MFDDFDKYMRVPDEWAPPEIKPYTPGVILLPCFISMVLVMNSLNSVFVSIGSKIVSHSSLSSNVDRAIDSKLLYCVSMYNYGVRVKGFILYVITYNMRKMVFDLFEPGLVLHN